MIVASRKLLDSYKAMGLDTWGDGQRAMWNAIGVHMRVRAEGVPEFTAVMIATALFKTDMLAVAQRQPRLGW